MSNQKSDAFEEQILKLAPGANLGCTEPYGYSDQRVRDMHAGWKLARDYDAPKLTQEAAEVAIRTAIRGAAGGHSLTNTARDSYGLRKAQ
jgi:hypothetical protein